MFKKLIYLVVLLMLTAGTTVQAEVFSDDFERARDYLTVGVTRSGWDGFLGLNPHETVDKLDASINRPRQLYIESTGGYYQEPFDPLGPFLYKNGEGDFIAVVRVTEFAGTLDEPLYHNAAGIMARALPDEGGPGEDEDWVSIAYFPTWTAFIAWNADDGVRTEFGQTTGTWLGDDTFAIAEQYPYLQLERVGNDFYFRISSDGVNFIPLTDPAYQGIYDGTQTPLVISRPDLDGLTLQVGLYQCTFSTDTGYVAFDDFSVEGPMVLSASKAYGPNPANEAKDVPRDVDLTWIPGMSADKHNVYFGTIFDDVNQANEANPQGVLVGQNQDGTTYDPGLLEFNKTYYWRVDEVNNLNPSSPWKGNVWSFTVANFTIVDDFEGYNNADNIIFNIWIDCVTNNTGMTVGHLSGDVAETYIVHNGKQSMYMYYDNDGSINEGQGLPLEKTGTLLYSEAERQWTDPQDWTVNGATSLTIWFRGLPPTYGSFTAGPPTYTMTARGSDIWLTSDQFHYAYKVLSGNGSITARLASITNTHQW
ncbi:MAG: hypothetical protein MUP16_08295, partial [Sedimentisphaerales bacterium]|nr:hypothetical protein [Sedimentisphaerales bacterium]